MQITRNNKEFTPTTKPWWTSHAFQMDEGAVGIARIHAISKNKEGSVSHYMLDLTQKDVDAIRSANGYSLLPADPHCGSIDSRPRPKTNDPAKRISSDAEQQQVIVDLQNEGNNEPEFVDHTPYHKGDNLP